MGKVYLLNAWGTERYKIGVTKSDVEKRLKQLQTGSSDELVIVKTFESDNYRKIEGWLHRKYKSKQVSGEWFELEDIDVLDFKKHCEEINETIDLLKKNNPFYD